jgi:alpha-L-fucosidase 2
MKVIHFFLISLFLLSCSTPQQEQPSSLKLWYESPADATVADSPNGWQDDAEWLKGLPLGNGSLGAVVFGDVAMERIQLNEDNPDAPQYLDKIRQLLFEDKYKEATELTNRTQVCTGQGSGGGNGSTVPFGCFQTMGDLWIDFANKEAYSDYRRELNLKGRDYLSLTRESIAKAEKKTFESLYQAHRKEYAAYFDRASFQLTESPDTLATDVLVAQAKAGEINPHLYELMFQYGRYLLISSSRPGTMPANLQGIWANKLQTPWNGDYHTDVNIEMNYWPAEVTNLSEMHLPMFDLIASLVAPGTKTAQTQYQKKGWVVHPITNVWGYTSPGEYASWGMHTGAPAWICQHIGEHYRFTGDKDFLRKMYPVLKGAVEFYMDWLVTDPKTDKLVSGPAVSPENTFVAPDGSQCQISMGPTHDQQTIWQLFDDFEMASEALQINDAFTQEVADAKGRLLETRIASDGRIMEWAQEFPEAEPGHRHISHLFAVHPGSQINLLQTPELAEAASKSMDYRISHGGGHTGWSSAWLISQYARLHRAEKAKESLDKVLEKSLNPNLFTQCPPFQIDANFGTTAGIAEMLLQSYIYEQGAYIIQLLPSLPEGWKNGKFSGLKARGGFEVSVEWKDGVMVRAEIKSLLGNPFRVWYRGEYIETGDLEKGKTWKWNS